MEFILSWRGKRLKDITSRHQDVEYVQTLQLSTWGLQMCGSLARLSTKPQQTGMTVAPILRRRSLWRLSSAKCYHNNQCNHLM